ncbi:MAG: FGGY-family carbohydrate kinase [Devosiaceae bacterium]|nr:FGGY-family carbohydrate kinase [Devosiaceae bacterium]
MPVSPKMSRPAPARFVAVIDIGKTNAKLALVDLETFSEIAVRTRPNKQLSGVPYPHADTEGIWEFVCKSLAELNQKTPIEAICCTTHGATAALVSSSGELALPVLDYEYSGPDECDNEYGLLRPEFSQSLTPPLPGGLNLGKQLFWQEQQFPAEFLRTKWILPYPQYWGFRLSGVVASEISSIGCHTDLWNFRTNQFSDLVSSQGWEEKFAPLRQANEVLGPIKQTLAQELGLNEHIPVHVGIHDSNASLLPHLIGEKAPFAVVSTGTWVVVCAPGGNLKNLDPTRDSYANIDVFGQTVPSARFMGGREFTNLIGAKVCDPDLDTIKHVLKCSWMLLPSLSQGSGPFPELHSRMSVAREEMSKPAYQAVVSLYLAMMTNECLDLAGALGDIIIEGPFVKNDLFLQLLQAASGRRVLAQKSNRTGTSIGAALLTKNPMGVLPPATSEKVSDRLQTELSAYAQKWRLATKEALNKIL